MNSTVSSNRILYTPSEFAKENLYHLQEIGVLSALKPHISQRTHLTSLLFFVVTKGSGVLVYQQKKYEIKEGDCVFIDCQNPYSHESSLDLWSLSWVHFWGPAAQKLYEKYVLWGGTPVLHPHSTKKYLDIIDTLLTHANSEIYARDLHINENLNSLLTLLLSETKPEEVSKGITKKQELSQIRQYLEENYPQKITLDDLAHRFYINKYYLTRIFREQYGVSINVFLLQIRITKAKQDLRFTDKSIEKIGYDCGIGPLYYFSRVFKTVEGISPGEYRKIW